MPAPAHVEVRTRIALEQTKQDFGYDPATHVAQALTTALDLGLLEHVEPQRGLAVPPERLQSQGILGQRGEPDEPRDGLTGGKVAVHPAFKVTVGEGVLLGPFGLADD